MEIRTGQSIYEDENCDPNKEWVALEDLIKAIDEGLPPDEYIYQYWVKIAKNLKRKWNLPEKTDNCLGDE